MFSDKDLKTTKWMKPIVDDSGMGINYLLIRAIQVFDHDDLFRVDFCDIVPVVHSYREIGTAVEVAIEVRYKSWFDGKTKVKFCNVVI